MTNTNSKFYKKIGRKGGLARIEKYGNPGTKEGRSKGGKISSEKNKLNPNFKSKIILPPFKKNALLAEVLGVFFGDGHLSKFQASITLDSQNDSEYVEMMIEIFSKLTKLHVGCRKRKDSRAFEIVVSSKSFVEHLNSLGMPAGNKLQKGLPIPVWIKGNVLFSRSFIKGVFDTDGCVFSDRKKYKNKIYHYLGVNISSASKDFLDELSSLLMESGISSTLTSSKSLMVRRSEDVDLFFKIIKPRNPKHLTRYQKFLTLSNGNVA